MLRIRRAGTVFLFDIERDWQSDSSKQGRRSTRHGCAKEVENAPGARRVPTIGKEVVMGGGTARN